MVSTTDSENASRGNILVGVDFSKASEKALREAAKIARSRGLGLFVLHVIDGGPLEELVELADLGAADLRDRLSRHRLSRLQEALDSGKDQLRGLDVEQLLAWGQPVEQILRKANEFAVEMIVLGTSGSSGDIMSVLFGGTAEKVTRGARCPVLCVPVP